MILKNISYENFRNHRSLTFDPENGINLIYGQNGSGKTSILEGIHYCALTKGFVSANDQQCLTFETEYFLVNGNFISETERQITVKISYKSEKKITVNNSEIKPFSHHIGTIPCITFSPPEISIVNGSPMERRRFIDNSICQTDRKYLDDLLTYRRVLSQRNTLLAQLKENTKDQDNTLSVWSEQLSRIAAAIVRKRVGFTEEILQWLYGIYKDLSVLEEPSLLYRCSLGSIRKEDSEEILYNRFLQKYKDTEKTDIFRSQTTIGPHRDDMQINLNEKEIGKYASQGQMRTFLIALKLAQHRYFNEKICEKPICLLDDIFSELDTKRTEYILALLKTYGQSIITSAEKKTYGGINAISIENMKKENRR
ncbi:MAG: DNA replication/repair protein RecF [Chlorobiaceae bacterium]|nr:DNA replication/repair protein RecF [Chlorobiaceae bacterium]